MNIIVKTRSGHIIVRPDTTWEKDNEDFYPPEFVDELTYSPVLFAHVLKPGRSISKKFASRYYDSIGFGMIIWPENMIDGTAESFAQAICLDHTSFLPYPMFPQHRLDNCEDFRLNCNGEELFSFGTASLEMIEDALVQATRMIYIRTGDLIAIELAGRGRLMTRQNGSAHVSGTIGQDKVLDFKVIF